MITERLYSLCGGFAEEQIPKKREAVRAADHIICISNATAEDLETFYPECRGKTSVVYLGAEHLTVSAREKQIAKKKPSVLFVGNRDLYKNFRTLLDAMKCREWPAELTLLVAGSPFRDHELALIDAMGLRNRVAHAGATSDHELSRLYQEATCFVFPSLLEGFGLPVIEAQANGCAVLASDIPVFREVAGNGALYFDPRLAESIAEACTKILDPVVCDELVQLGFVNVKRFSWDTAATQTVKIYRRIART